MKKYSKEIIVFVFQVMVFYLIPFTAGPTDGLGLVVVIWFATLLLSIVFGLVSQKKRKIIYPFVVAIVFIPTVFIHYNYTAFGHVIWYLIDSYLGVGIGSLIKMITDVLSQKKR